MAVLFLSSQPFFVLYLYHIAARRVGLRASPSLSLLFGRALFFFLLSVTYDRPVILTFCHATYINTNTHKAVKRRKKKRNSNFLAGVIARRCYYYT